MKINKCCKKLKFLGTVNNINSTTELMRYIAKLGFCYRSVINCSRGGGDKRESKQRKQCRRSHVKSHNWKGRYQEMQLQLRGETGKKKTRHSKISY